MLLHGVMGADLIGFHTYDYVQHFLQSVKMILGVENYFHNLQYQDRFDPDRSVPNRDRLWKVPFRGH